MSLSVLRRVTSTLLLCALVAAAGRPAAAEALTPHQKSAVDREIHDYIMNHPDVLLDALKAAQEKSDAETAAQASRMIVQDHKQLFDDPDDLVAGNPKGTATIVEFFDYRCPYCKQLQPTLDALLDEDSKLRVVYKEFPILGEASVFATRAALAARQQGKYAAFHRAMMATKGDVTDATVLKVAATVGLDLDKLKADMRSPDIDHIIEANYKLASALGIDGTPGLIVGNTLIPGAVDIGTLRKDIAAARKSS